MTASALSELGDLDRQRLHVFVAGSGRGEAIAVALPGQGWVVLDGCRVRDGTFPIERVLSRWRVDARDAVELLVFTHPHEDHAAGIPDVIEHHPLRRIALAVPDPPGPWLLAELVTRAREAQTTSERLDASAVRSAVAAIHGWSVKNPGGLIAASDGVTLELEPSVEITMRSPDKDSLVEFMATVGTRDRIRARANEMSVVVEIRFGSTHVVLGADLPRFRSGGEVPVRTGWNAVLGRHGHLGRHHGLKVPHHGSREAQHPDLMTTRSGERDWWLTPQNSSRLPRLAEGDGLDQLLERQSSICLTALPAALSVQAAAHDAWRVRRGDLERRLEAQVTGDPFLEEGIELRPGTACEALDAIWCGAFDDAGHLVGRWRGTAALEVVSG